MPDYRIEVGIPTHDCVAIADLIVGGIEHTPYKGIEIDRNNLENSIFNIITGDPRDSIIFLLFSGDEYVGLLAANTFNQHPLWHEYRIATELFWFVKPDHRGKHSMLLIAAYEQWCKDNNCDYATLVHFEPDSRLEKVYKSLGYTKIESSYIKAI